VDAKTLFVTYPVLPARHVALPHDRTRFLVPQDHADAWRHRGQQGWECGTYSGRRPSAKQIAEQALELLGLAVKEKDDLNAITEAATAPDRFQRHEGFWVRRGDLGGQDAVVIGEVVHGNTYRIDQLTPKKEGLVVVDVGAHIGSFAKAWHEKDPSATIVCVEACPENLPVLACNVAGFASIIHAACTYVPGRLALRNSVKAGGSATGGSIVLPLDEIENQLQAWGAAAHLYWEDRRILPKVTLEQIMGSCGVDRIDLLKLDCEGSEFSILSGCDISKIGCIVGEWHGDSWEEFRQQRLSRWEYVVTHGVAGSNIGSFRARNPEWCNV
jgi:FkbM family methyltransferase